MADHWLLGTLIRRQEMRAEADRCFVRILSRWKEGAFHYVVFEKGHSLAALHQEKCRMDEVEARQILIGVCEGLLELERLGAAHLNIKPENIIRVGKCYKLMDPFYKDTSMFTNNYRQRGYTTESDVYSLGRSILYAMFGTKPAPLQLRDLMHAQYSSGLKDMIGRMISNDLQARPTPA